MRSEQIQKILIPSAFQIVLCLLLSAGIIAVVYSNALVAFITHQSGITNEVLQASYHDQLVNLNHYSVLQTGVTGAFWAAVGLAAYVIYLVFSNAMIGLRNEVLVETQYINKGNQVKYFVRVVTHALLAILLIVALIVSAKVMLPTWMSFVEQYFILGGMWWQAVWGWLGLSFNIFVIWTLAQFAIAY